MPICPDCGQELPTPKALQVHRKLSCKAKQTEPILEIPEREDVRAPVTIIPALPEQAEFGEGHLFYPRPDPNYYVSGVVIDELSTLEVLSRSRIVNVLVTGQQGSGKTSLGLQFAAKFNRPCVVVDIGAYQEPQQLLQTTALEEGQQGSYTVTKPSALIQGLETERCLVILDELNRPENERVLNPLYPFLDERGGAYIDELHRRVNRAKGVIVWATINEGSLFCGTIQSDEALRDRFREVKLQPITNDTLVSLLMAKTSCHRKDAVNVATFVSECQCHADIERKISLRQALHIAEELASGAPLWRAVMFCAGRSYDVEWRQKIFQLLSTLLSYEERNEFTSLLEKQHEYRRW